MALTFVYGNAGNGKSEYMYQKIADMAQCAPYQHYFVVVPEQFTMSAQKSLTMHAPNGVITNIDVVSFDRLAYRVFDELGIHRTVMEETGKSLVLRRIVEQEESQLTLLKRNITKMGYIGEVKSVLSELMQYGISTEEIESLIDAMGGDSSLCYKLRDILSIYRAFDDYLQEGYVTAERLLDVLTEVAGESTLLRDAVFLFDGSTGFTPVQVQFLRPLMHLASDIFVTVTLDTKEPLLATAHIEDLFYMSHKMVNALTQAARDASFEIAEPIRVDSHEKSRLAGNPIVTHLEQNLFRIPGQSYPEETGEALSVYSMLTARDELLFAAATIRDLVREKGYRYRDFAIVCSEVGQYETYAESVFALYDIPGFVDQKQTILYHPLTELVRSVAELADTNYSHESVFRFLRTGLAGFTQEETDLLENYCIANGIHGANKWKNPFERIDTQHGRLTLSGEACIEELTVLNALRERFVSFTQPLYDVFRRKEATVRERTIALYALLSELGAEDALRNSAERFAENGDERNAAIDRQIYRIVIDLLDKMVDLLGEDTLSAADYSEILDAGLAAARVGRIPPGSDCVILGDIERTRMDNVKVLFFLGVNDGMIPKKSGRTSLLSQYDREELKERNVTLAPNEKEQTFLQRFYLYLALTKPSEALYLTMSRMDADGKSIRPSYLIGVLQKLFPNLSVVEIDAHPDLPLVSEKSSISAFLNGLEQSDLGKADPVFSALHRWYEQHASWSGRIQSLLDAHFAVHGTKRLTPALAEALYGAVLYNSVTRLERFGGCPFAHYLEFGLRLAERKELSFASPDMGTLFHETLHIYGTLLEEETTWASVTGEQSDELLDRALREAVEKMGSGVLGETAANAYMLTRIRRILKRSIWAVTEQIRRSAFLPDGYEIPFERDEDASRSHLVGYVDRMDVCEEEDSVFVRVIDYKSSETKIHMANLFYGRQFQLAVYLDTAMRRLAARYPEKEIVPAGIFYLHLDDPMAEKATEPAEVEKELLTALRPSGLVNEDPSVFRLLDLDLQEGDKSEVAPLSLNKDGSLSRAASNAASTEDFQTLIEYVRAYTDRAAEEMLSGEMDTKPFRMGKNTGCDYCAYCGVCGFDLRIPGYGYREEQDMKEAETWEKIRESRQD